MIVYDNNSAEEALVDGDATHEPRMWKVQPSVSRWLSLPGFEDSVNDRSTPTPSKGEEESLAALKVHQITRA